MARPKVKKAVIPAAGLGTRFLPATKAQPKEMLPIVDKPTIQYVVEEAVAAGIEDILIITGRNKRAIEDHFDHCVEVEMTLKKKGKEAELQMIREISEMVDIHYVRQKEPLGLGTPFTAPGNLSRTSPLPCCWVTTSSTALCPAPASSSMFTKSGAVPCWGCSG